jgi:hypothetical protein
MWHGMGIFLFTTASRLALRSTQPRMQWVIEDLSLGLKRPSREANHSPPRSTEFKNAWSYTSTPSIRFHGVWCSDKWQGQFYPYFIAYHNILPVLFTESEAAELYLQYDTLDELCKIYITGVRSVIAQSV